ncbi:MAG: hypothetical protein E7053_10105 [Lentisphaerae bacterium]|nr:hypothetical protein [Lentisphaerota bacterium]
MNQFTPQEIDKLFDQAQTVKINNVREVRRNGELFLKLDRRKNHSFKREFQTAIQLKAAGLPVTEPVCYTSSVRGNYLVTRTFNGVSVEDFLKTNQPDEKFFIQIADLLKHLLDSGFIHKDFHLGNLLYSPEEKRFALVDVDAICRPWRFWLKFVPEKVKFHLLMEFRHVLDKKDLLKLFSRFDITDPEKFYQEIFIADAIHISKEWHRRREQILNGYPKFVNCMEGELFDRDAKESDFRTAIKIDRGLPYFLAHFYLDLIKIPHRRVLRYSPSDGSILIAPANNRPAPAEAIEDMIERLSFYGIKTSPEQWQAGAGNLPELHNLEKVAASSFIMEGLSRS